MHNIEQDNLNSNCGTLNPASNLVSCSYFFHFKFMNKIAEEYMIVTCRWGLLLFLTQVPFDFSSAFNNSVSTQYRNG